ncbi:hypothetical protein GQR58_023181 [Nymphon striatum]|nr:hypothetical protein GQR58_023181 [Nymphon striatum]
MDETRLTLDLTQTVGKPDRVSAEPWNRTFNYDLENLPLDSNFAWLLCALFFAMTWVIYITYYNSRVIGFLCTKVINKFMPVINLCSISVSVLSGKIMFRDIIYMTMDYTVRIQDGWMIFRWWRAYVPRELTEDLSHSDTRLSILLNGLEFHMYNRTELYARLEKLFGLDCQLKSNVKKEASITSLEALTTSNDTFLNWRDLIPVVKLEIYAGCIVFGNHLVPTTLLVTFEDGHVVYTTKPAQSKHDLFTHIVKFKAENAKVLFAPSPKYTGMVDDPPRYMGEGFVVLQSNLLDVYYYMDEPGLIPAEPEIIQLADGDLVEVSTYPCWGVDIKCGKGTDFSYGPWADRQREQLFKFFFPQDYQTLEPTVFPEVGERRIFQSFDVRLSSLSDATIDILFSKDKLTNAVHFNIGPGSYLETNIPWFVTKTGYSTQIIGQLLHVDGSTSLQYRSLVDSETLQFEVSADYPLRWNLHQNWKCVFTACKATISLIYAHKQFFQDMMNDWGSKAQPDMYHFVPYTWHFNFIIKEFELITLANEYNWIDCSSHHQENGKIILISCLIDPEIFRSIYGFITHNRIYRTTLTLFTCHNIIKLINDQAKIVARDGSIINNNVTQEKKWRNFAKPRYFNGWIECWSVPILAFKITYIYYPISTSKHTYGTKKNFTTPEKEEILLAPIRPNCSRSRIQVTPDDFDRTLLPPDCIKLELEIGPSIIKIYGTLPSIFYEYQGDFVDFEAMNSDSKMSQLNETFNEPECDIIRKFDGRNYRPLQVTANVVLHEIQAHIMKNCTESDPPCPVLYVDRVGFEMLKVYSETQMQLLLTPVIICVYDNYSRLDEHHKLSNGHVMFSGLQVKGHAMFSDEERSLDSETLEYAWLVDVQCKELTDLNANNCNSIVFDSSQEWASLVLYKLLTLHKRQQTVLSQALVLQHLVTSLETLILLTKKPGNTLHNPMNFQTCQHDLPQQQCKKTTSQSLCPSAEDLKYRMTRVSANKILFNLVESDTCLNINLSPLRFSTCNLHGNRCQNGFTCVIHDIVLQQYIKNPSSSSSSAPENSDHTPLFRPNFVDCIWLEAGAIRFGPVVIEVSHYECSKRLSMSQNKFLEMHDSRTKRLWFLWLLEEILNFEVSPKVHGKCGCVGGCHFYMKTNDDSHYFNESPFNSNESLADINFGTSYLKKESQKKTSSNLKAEHKYFFSRNRENMENVLHNRKTGTTLSAEALIQIHPNNRVMRQHSCDSKPNQSEKNMTKGSITSPPSLHSNMSHGEHKDFRYFPDKFSAKPSTSGAVNLAISSNGLQKLNQTEPALSRMNSSNISSASVCSLSKQSSMNGKIINQNHSIRSNSIHSSDTFFSADEEEGVVKPERPSNFSNDSNVNIVNKASLKKSIKKKKLRSVGSGASIEDTKLLLDSAKHKEGLGKCLNPGDSDSSSVSSSSFLSAVSSQEDVAMVDLHTQMNKSITESPILLACYSNHLSQSSCEVKEIAHPSFSFCKSHIRKRCQPEFINISQGKISYVRYIMIFRIAFFHGFTSIQVEDKLHYSKLSTKTPLSANSQFTNTFSDFTPINDFSSFFETSSNYEAEEDACKLSESNDASERSTIIIKLLSHIDIYFSPVVLQCLQRMVDALTPTLSSLHPMSIVNSLYLDCTSAVEKQNYFKNHKFSHPDKLKKLLKEDQNCTPAINRTSKKYTERLNTLFQASITIPQININVMQTAIVDEVISFSALENMHDLTCPSLFTICLQKISMKVYSCKQIDRSIQIYDNETPTESTAGRMSSFRWATGSSTKKPKQDSLSDPFSFESVDASNHDLIICFSVEKIHTQIRRLCNSLNSLKDAVLTDIPSHQSKVLFTLHGCGYYDQASEMPNIDNEQIGFIMFECGLEGVKFRLLKSVGSGNPKEPEIVDSNFKDNDSNITKEEGIKTETDNSELKSDTSSVEDNASWTSRISIPSQIPECGSTADTDTSSQLSVVNIDRNTTSGVIKVKNLWFNFAAPPKSPNTRKIDFTRMDWHLLSTVSPALNAWLNPFDRLKASVQAMLYERNSRRCAVIASLMIEALEEQSIHIPLKRKYQRITPLARSILDDPSCQLLVVLTRFLKKEENLSSLQGNLVTNDTPHLDTLHRGLMAVSRQWKNILYIPILVEQNLKLKSNAQGLLNSTAANACASKLLNKSQVPPDDESLDDTEGIDEKTQLLKAGLSGQQYQRVVNEVISQSSIKQDISVVSPVSTCIPTSDSRQDLTRESAHNGTFKKKKLPSYIPQLSRASIAFPLFSNSDSTDGKLSNAFTSLFSRSAAGFNRFIGKSYSSSSGQQYQHVPLKMKQKDESTPSMKSIKSLSMSSSGADCTLNQHDIQSSSAIGTPFRSRQVADQQDGIVINENNEDLYNWMAREQEKFSVNFDATPRVTIVTNPDQYHESNITTLTSDHSKDENSWLNHESPFINPPLVAQADANVIFQPLLNNLNALKALSPVKNTHNKLRVSVYAAVDLMKIDIAESASHSDILKKRRQRRGKGRLFCNVNGDQAAFLCDNLNFVIEMRDVIDFEKKGDEKQDKTLPLWHDFKKRITRVISFDVNASFMAQQVNMPLLRLIHQFSTMYDNVKETQHALKEKRQETRDCVNTGSLSSESHTDSGTIRYQNDHLIPTDSEGTNHRTPIFNSSSTHASLSKMSHREKSPLSLEISDCIARKMPSLSQSEEIFSEAVESKKGKNCWKTMYYLLDLYDTMPDMKTVDNRSPLFTPVVEESILEKMSIPGKYEHLKEHRINIEYPEAENHYSSSHQKHTSPIVQNHVNLVIFGLLKIQKTRLLATLSGLKLEAELEHFHVSATHKEMAKFHLDDRNSPEKKWYSSSITGNLGKSMVILLEGIPPTQQTVVKMNVGKSQTLYSALKKKRSGKDRSSALLTIGPIQIDIPQHPVVLHGMMTRGTKQLSTTLQELRASTIRQSARSRLDDSLCPSESLHSPKPSMSNLKNNSHPSNANGKLGNTDSNQPGLIQPIAIQFNIILESLTVGAALLPSLTAKYQMGQITSSGVTGCKAKFTIDLPKHCLSFNTKLLTVETNLPSSAVVALPPVHVAADYIQNSTKKHDQNLLEGVVLREGSYLNAIADIGSFEHSLTTDLLNHLVFIQKVFMKEVNEVVQKVSGADCPIFNWPEVDEEKPTTVSGANMATLLFSLQLKLGGIQITAMTPTNSAVRFETGNVELQLSNRVQNMSRGTKHTNANSEFIEISPHCDVAVNFVKLFGKVQLDMNLALGQLIKNAVFEEAEPEFQQLAYFKTRIIMRNALQDEMVASQSDDKQAVLITLNRPLIHVQPIALDKAILVWLNYKNAYEYWNEQRANLNKEVLTATQQVFEKVPQFSNLTTSQTVSTLFLQLTIDDLGICLPLNSYTGLLNNRMAESELKSALVVTLESTRISACSCRSLVSKGRFTDLCLRFADDFETSLDDWKPDPCDSSNMNLFVVSEGTYDVCSQTVTPQSSENAKWILNVQWQMEGVDIHVDTNIGKQLSSLFNTLTALTGDDQTCEEDKSPAEKATLSHEKNSHYSRSHVINNEAPPTAKSITQESALPLYVFDPIVDAKKRSRLIEKEMNEQAKIVNDLKFLGASENTIEQELKHLQELESLVFNDFRRDMIKKLRRQSVKQATSIRGKLGLGSDTSPSHSRSKSIVIPQKYAKYSPFNELDTNGSSLENSPTYGHIRAASLDAAHISRVSFGKASNIKGERSMESRSPNVVTATIYEPRLEMISSPSDSSSATSDVTKNSFSGDQLPPSRSENQSTSEEYTRPDTTSSPQQLSKMASIEPSVDFELDVKVFINSWKVCFSFKRLHRTLRKDRSYSGSANFDFPVSPSHKKRGLMGVSSGGYMRTNLSTSKLKYLQIPAQSQTADYSIFFIPGLDVKVQYRSKTNSIDSGNNDSSKCERSTGSEFMCKQNVTQRKTGNKKASLYAWLTLQSIPEETVITPHILDFFENALEPIPIPIPPFSASNKAATGHNTLNSQDTNNSNVFGKLNADSESTSLSAPNQYTTSSFPVDVIVYFCMQPSILRFSCLPISRVECWLRLPSVDLIFSSKRIEDENISKVSQRVLSDFSLHIFHPYGGSKKAGATAGKLSGISSPLGDSERKDSLSVQVEFVKVNISRSRKINPVKTNSDMKSSESMKYIDVPGGAFVNVSTIIDIGSACFKYDMRRLTEILAFPKAWYRKKIARRLFLGDQSSTAVFNDSGPDETKSLASTLSPDSSCNKPSDIFTFPSSSSSSTPISATTCGLPPTGIKSSKDPSKLDLPVKSFHTTAPPTPILKPEQVNNIDEFTSHSMNINKPIWETLLRFTINLSKLNVQMNMGNVMGNTTWSTKGIKSEGHLSIASSGHKNIVVAIGLAGSSIDAKGGIVGGTFDLCDVNAFMHIKEDPGQEPDHTIQVKIYALESRLDYMGTSVWMSRASSLNVMMKDEWRVNIDNKKCETFLPTKRPAIVFVHCDLTWDQFHMMMSRSTNTDFLKMCNKLEEFFSQQFHSSKRVLSSLQPHRSSVKKKSSFNEQNKPTFETSVSHENEAKHHRHWQNVLKCISGLQLGMLTKPLPAHGTIVGGTVDLGGSDIHLACFHGINFRAKSWVMFCLKEPKISFAAEAQDIVENGWLVTLTLLHTARLMPEDPVVSVSKMSRTALFPPQYKTMQEWLVYAFSSSKLAEA